jgi:LAS superfamily LD-carboxypeptidase LdcB
MAKKKLKKKNIFVAVTILILIIVAIIMGIKIKKDMDYKKTYEYKLLNLGYNEASTAILIKELSTKELDQILKMDLYEALPSLVGKEYYIHAKMKDYLAYFNTLEGGCKDDACYTEVVTVVNAGADKEWYTEVETTDTSKGSLILVNKFHQLDEKFETPNLVDVLNWYAYGDKPRLNQEAYDNFISMYNAAKEDKMNIFMNSAYRSYQEQDKLYTDYKTWYGQKRADETSAKAGFSEHQTGLAVDISTYGANIDNFDTYKESEWLKQNAYKYGYILRYPKGKEHLTGYTYEPWHYRYVGKDVATYIFEHDITFEEYYTFYIER